MTRALRIYLLQGTGPDVMKHWSSALFPLTILLALTGLTLWLRYATELPELQRDGKHRHDPDYILSNIVLRKLGADGRLKYTLRAADVRHYPDDDTTDFIKPHVVYQYVEKPPLTISAEFGRSSQDNERIDLKDNVWIYRPPSDKDLEMTASMPELTVFPDDEKAFTKSPVFLTQGKSWVRGIGMQVDQRLQTYVLESQVTGLVESKPKPAREKKS